MTTRRTASLLLASCLLVTACGDDDTTAADDTTTTAAPQNDQSTSSTTAEETSTTEDGGEVTVLEISVTGDQVTGGGRHSIGLGDTVTLRVTSDVADEVHLHGYDLHVDVGAGETAELTFEATIPGVFEAELEDAGLQLLELEIS